MHEMSKRSDFAPIHQKIPAFYKKGLTDHLPLQGPEKINKMPTNTLAVLTNTFIYFV